MSSLPFLLSRLKSSYSCSIPYREFNLLYKICGQDARAPGQIQNLNDTAELIILEMDAPLTLSTGDFSDSLKNRIY